MSEIHATNELSQAKRRPGPAGPDRCANFGGRADKLPTLPTVDDTADLLRTTRRAVYAMVERRQLPGVIRLRRRVNLSCRRLARRVGPEARAIPRGVTGDEHHNPSVSKRRLGG